MQLILIFTFVLGSDILTVVGSDCPDNDNLPRFRDAKISMETCYILNKNSHDDMPEYEGQKFMSDKLIIRKIKYAKLGNNEGGLRVMIVEHQDEPITIVAFKASGLRERDLKQRKNIFRLEDLQTSQLSLEGYRFTVISYFANALDVLYHQNWMRLLQDPTRKYIITGYSLGGGIASLFALKTKLLKDTSIWSNDQSLLITFGQPRIGDEYFASLHEEQISEWKKYRFIVRTDPVTDLPRKIGNNFVHHSRGVHVWDDVGIPGGTLGKKKRKRKSLSILQRSSRAVRRHRSNGGLSDFENTLNIDNKDLELPRKNIVTKNQSSIIGSISSNIINQVSDEGKSFNNPVAKEQRPTVISNLNNNANLKPTKTEHSKPLIEYNHRDYVENLHTLTESNTRQEITDSTALENSNKEHAPCITENEELSPGASEADTRNNNSTANCDKRFFGAIFDNTPPPVIWEVCTKGEDAKCLSGGSNTILDASDHRLQDYYERITNVPNFFIGSDGTKYVTLRTAIRKTCQAQTRSHKARDNWKKLTGARGGAFG
ncbi:uncharacterized protein [Clytia hemisphaerica]|uniref:Fungal lipase-type domain-containing protein n=1 Tax=Clytia hemisphaerica TaxID=252671 RepID=A0A7M5UNB2_9CNID